MITNKTHTVTALDEARIIIANQDNKINLQQIKINSMGKENDALLMDNFMLYDILLRELLQKFNSEHVVELINTYKISTQYKIQELLEFKNKANFLERQRNIYQKAFSMVQMEGKEKLLAKAEEDYNLNHT